MTQKKLSQRSMMNRIIRMKETGIARQDVQKVFESQNLSLCANIDVANKRRHTDEVYDKFQECDSEKSAAA